MTDEPLVATDAGSPLPTIEDATIDASAPGAVRTETVGARPPGPRRPRPNPIRAFRFGVDAVVAVGVKELRGRVRGRRAFVVLTFYLLYLTIRLNRLSTINELARNIAYLERRLRELEELAPREAPSGR